MRTGSDLRGISLFAKGRSSTATGDLALLSLAIESRLYGQESGTHCNYYRNYDPGIGRYVQSDPIGLAAGINTYGYVKNNPLGKADRLGLAPTIGMTWLPGQLLNWLKPPAPPPDEGGSCPAPTPPDCDKVLKQCREICLDTFVNNPDNLPGRGSDYFGRQRRCIRECMEANGCFDF